MYCIPAQKVSSAWLHGAVCLYVCGLNAQAKSLDCFERTKDHDLGARARAQILAGQMRADIASAATGHGGDITATWLALESATAVRVDACLQQGLVESALMLCEALLELPGYASEFLREEIMGPVGEVAARV